MTNPREAQRIVEELFLPLVSSIPGFVAYYFVDAGSGVMLSTSVFQSKEGADESNRRAATLVREKMSSVLPQPVMISKGEVVAFANTRG